MSAGMKSEPSVRIGDDAAAAADLPLALYVNGEPRRTSSQTLAGLIEESGYAAAKVATAVNGDFVPARARSTTELRAGDRIEIVAPRQGG